MKKNLALLLILVLIIFTVSCSSDDEKKEETKEETKTEQVEDKEESKEKEEKKEEKKEEETKTEEVKKEETGEKDLSLLNSLNFERPDSISYKATIKIMGMSETKMSMYIMGENYRLENEMEGKVNVIIYNDDEGMSYSYVEGENVGFKYPSQDNAAFETPEPEIDVEQDEDFYDVLKRDKLDGKDVIYGEFSESDSEGTFTTKMWMSEEYQMPLKVQIVNEAGEVFSEMNYTDIVVNTDLSDKFIPPSNVSFE
ncbi:MAG: hypothetical protein CSB16_01755 [Clostridiales bacterium]|nr:MAG: hypothetical protein CSB16_01755 [Clostridiales bacterium]